MASVMAIAGIFVPDTLRRRNATGGLAWIISGTFSICSVRCGQGLERGTSETPGLTAFAGFRSCHAPTPATPRKFRLIWRRPLLDELF